MAEVAQEADPEPQEPVVAIEEPEEKEQTPDLAPETPTPEPAAPEPVKKPKRLTLQERLALAAKAKKKALVTPVESRAESPIEPEVAKFSEKTETQTQEVVERTEPPPHNESVAELQAELAQVKSKLVQATDENRMLREKVTSSANTAEMDKKLAEKDETIKQLMEEGQTLSKRELKLNERIRTLVQNNSKLETSLKSYSEKNEETLLKLSEIEDVMKTHKIKSVDQLFELLNNSNAQVQELQHSLDKEKESNWEAKYKELQKMYETELNDKKSYIKQLNDSALELQMLKQQVKLDVQSKEELISQLNREIVELRDENSAEVTRLESKIEGLRMENESFLKMSQNGVDAGDDNAEAHKQIEYLEFAKLSETHRNLQAQYVSSQENWKLIESNLLNKVDGLTSSLESLKKSKLKSANEVKKLNSQVSALAEQISKFKQEVAVLRNENKELVFQIQVKVNEYTELEEKLEELKTVFNSDRQNYDIKINALNESIRKYEGQSQVYNSSTSSDNVSSLQSRRLRDSGLHINLEARSFRNYSSQSMNSLGTPIQQWEEANASAPFTPYGIDQHQYSSSSLTEELHPFDAPDSAAETSFNFKSETPTLPSSGATKNVQLINKMSSSIRRLELELLSLKEENEQITAEKDTAQQEVMGKYDLEKQVSKLEETISQLQKEVAERSKKEETLLEVIGEKSEKVAELQADVVDLKDLCRQQVQQMIEMVGK
ncbi:CIC11C00000002995 [Sungouiella intermedia]|uniref:CIC11C00000002995 n=1 Tax=Sungouiella intermedia TaxID=45354 RepID=A0A1L0BWE7_9ASCO|nr:CIC11C00000002995 [[Candida] intermedia]